MTYLQKGEKRGGLGTIIGAAFFLLTFTSVVSFLFMYLNVNRGINEVYGNSRDMDLNKEQEKLELYNIELNGGTLNISIKNIGRLTSSITYIGEINEEVPSASYFPSNIVIGPGETATNVAGSNITYGEGELLEIQVVTKYGNVFTYIYPEEDGSAEEIMLNLFKVGPPFYPSYYRLLGQTFHVDGGVDDLASDDGSYLQFSSFDYYSREIFYLDNNNSDVDGNISIGSHHVFSDMLLGPDSAFDTLSEEETVNLGATHYIKPSMFQDPNNKWDNEPNAYDNNNLTSATSSRNRVLDNIYWQSFNSSDKGTIGKVDLHIRLDVNFNSVSGGSDSITIQWWVGGSQGEGTYTIDQGNDGSDLHITFLDVDEPNDGVWSWSDIASLEVRQVGSQTGPPDSVSVSTDEVWGMVTTYAQELDLEVQFSGVDYTLDNEMFCIFTDNGGDEGLQVDVWFNSAWETVFPSLGSGWNNASVSTYLNQPTLTVRFKDVEVLGDSLKSSWDVDVVLLSLWDDSSEETVSVEFGGLCNVSDIPMITLTADINCNVSSVSISLQLYDYEAQAYSLYGEGYLSYISSSVSGTDEESIEIISGDANRFVNSSGHWKLKLTGAKDSNITYQLNTDLVEFNPFYMLPGLFVEYDEWTKYGFKASHLKGAPVKYGVFSIYHNATCLELRDTINLDEISNPDLLLLDVYGVYYFDLRSSFSDSEIFYLGCTLGDVETEKVITQMPP